MDQNKEEKRARSFGIEKGKKEIAKRLLKANMSIEQIVEITGLTEEEIKELKND